MEEQRRVVLGPTIGSQMGNGQKNRWPGSRLRELDWNMGRERLGRLLSIAWVEAVSQKPTNFFDDVKSGMGH